MNLKQVRHYFTDLKYKSTQSKPSLTVDADSFAKGLGYSDKLASSLLKLQIQNLSTMDADWIYASYHYSHPLLTERLGALGWQGGKVSSEKTEDIDKAVKAADREL